MDDADNLLAELAIEVLACCPRCGHPGLELDLEFKAYVHDYCGYWLDK